MAFFDVSLLENIHDRDKGRITSYQFDYQHTKRTLLKHNTRRKDF